VDELIKWLRHSALGVYIAIGTSSQHAGSILYARDIIQLSGSCYGLQIMLNMCRFCSHEWDIFLILQNVS